MRKLRLQNWTSSLMILLAGWLFALPLSAATVVGVVSERSAAEMAAGAERFLAANPDHGVILRTPEPLAAVFGDQVGRIEQAVRDQAAARSFPILAVNGDRALSRLSRLDGRAVLDGLDASSLNDLMKAPEPGADVKAHRATLRQQFPQQAPWLDGRALYQGRTPQHLDGLLR